VVIAQPYASAALAEPEQRRPVTRGEQTFRGSVRDAGELRPLSDGDDAIGAELLRELGLRDVGVLLVRQENLQAKLALNCGSLGVDDNVAGLLRP